MTKLIFGAAFAAGLATLGWVGAGYFPGHVLALSVTLLIAAFYLAGAFELFRYNRGTRALGEAVQSLSTPPASLDEWLAPLPAGLAVAVRQRVEGLRAGLPGTVLASYLTGLLILLGMLGTFLGMVVTLQGTGSALLGAEGLQAIRDALAAPVQGLGLAFGTSVAGVAASAALGLMASLARRERMGVAQRLDAAMGASLKPFTLAHQRESSLRFMAQQAELMPELVEKISACMSTLQAQQAALSERLSAEQSRFHAETEAVYKGLAVSVERTLTESAAQSARQAGEAIQPAIQAALTGLARESAQMQAAQADQVRQQLDGIASRFGDATDAVSTQWTRALAVHQETSEGTTQALRETLSGFTEAFDSRSAQLAEGLFARLEEQSQVLSTRWSEALTQQQQSGEQMALRNQQALQEAAQGLEQSHAAMQSRMAEQEAERQSAWTDSLQSLAATLKSEWQQASERSAAQWQALGGTLASTSEGITRQLEAQAHSTLGEIRALMQAASEAPRAAAEVVGDLHHKLAEFGNSTAAATAEWGSVLAAHRQSTETTAQALRDTLNGFTDSFEVRSAALAETLAQRLEQQAQAVSTHWGEALELQTRSGEQFASRNEQALLAATQGIEQAYEALQSRISENEVARQEVWTTSLHQLSASLQNEWQQAGDRSATQWQDLGEALKRTTEEISGQLEAQAQGTLNEIRSLMQIASNAPRATAEAMGEVQQKLAHIADNTIAATSQWTRALAVHQETSEGTTQALRETLSGFTEAFDSRSAQLAEGLFARLEEQSQVLSTRWSEALTQQQQSGEQMALRNQQALQEAAHGLEQSHAAMQSRMAEQEAERQSAWTDSLQSLAATLKSEWQQASERSAAQWQALGGTLASTSEGITRQLEAQAHSTLGEIRALMQAASEAPRAAADVIAELRQKLTDSMERDNAMLAERNRTLETLSTLLDAVNHASAEQRGAIEALVTTTSNLMESASGRFAETLDAQAGRIDAVAAQISGSAVEVASLGEAFGAGVQHFGEANEQLVAQLQRVEAALSKSLARSDEQLDYYVAQAREVIELSTGAQKQIIDELRQLSVEREA